MTEMDVCQQSLNNIPEELTHLVISFTDYSTKLSLWWSAKWLRRYLPAKTNLQKADLMRIASRDGNCKIIRWFKQLGCRLSKKDVIRVCESQNTYCVKYLLRRHHRKYGKIITDEVCSQVI